MVKIIMEPLLTHLRLFQQYWGQYADEMWNDIVEAAEFYSKIENDPSICHLLIDLEVAQQLGLVTENIDDDSPVWRFWTWGRRLVPEDVEYLKAHFSSACPDESARSQPRR